MIQFSCEKTLLQNAISIAGRAVPPKSSIPALEGLLLSADQGITVTGFNLQTGIRTAVPADVKESGDVALNARLFGDIIRKMPDDIVSVTVDNQYQTRLTCGDSDFTITALPAADFPDLPQVEGDYGVRLPQKALRDMIDQTTFAVSTNESRPVHMGALFEVENMELTMVAVDGFRLAIRREPVAGVEGGAFTFVAPGTALNEVKNICGDTEDAAAVTLGKKHILFEVNDTQLICRRLEGEFLNYRNSVPRNNPITMVADTRELMSSIDRVSVVISEKMKSPVRCQFGNGRVILTARTGYGESRDICPLVGDGGDLTIGFNNRYLTEALRYAPADTVRIELNTGISPAIIVPDEDAEIGREKFLYMVLPVRLKT